MKWTKKLIYFIELLIKNLKVLWKMFTLRNGLYYYIVLRMSLMSFIAVYEDLVLLSEFGDCSFLGNDNYCINCTVECLLYGNIIILS